MRKKEELTLEGKGIKTSLPYPSGGEMKKGSLGLPLIPPILKAGSLTPDSAAGSLCSSLQLDLLKSQEMRARSNSRSHETSLEHAESSESTRKTQRKEEKSSHCKTGPGMPLLPRELTDPFSLEDSCAGPRTWRSVLLARSGGLGPGAPGVWISLTERSDWLQSYQEIFPAWF
ncbi:uncharacterized protein GJ701_002690 [Geothlypis trichas]